MMRRIEEEEQLRDVKPSSCELAGQKKFDGTDFDFRIGLITVVTHLTVGPIGCIPNEVMMTSLMLIVVRTHGRFSCAAARGMLYDDCTTPRHVCQEYTRAA